MAKSASQIRIEIAEHQDHARLRAKIQRLLAKWETKLGVHVRDWNVRTMKTYWASVNERDGRMTFNTKLADMSPAFIEVTVVHEIVHLLTDGHDAKFYDLMDRHVPGWRRLHAKYAEPMTRDS